MFNSSSSSNCENSKQQSFHVVAELESAVLRVCAFFGVVGEDSTVPRIPKDDDCRRTPKNLGDFLVGG